LSKYHMDVLFLSDREDPILYSAFNYFSSMYDCAYNQGKDATVVVANHCVPYDKKNIYFYTNPEDDFTNQTTRRLSINLLQNSDILCCSLYLAKRFLAN